MEPHGVVDGGGLYLRRQELDLVLHSRDAKQQQVGQVGQHS